MLLNRRKFVHLVAGTTAACRLPIQAQANTSSPTLLLTPQYGQVKVNGGLAREQADNAKAVLATFDDDALLKPFRAMGGQSAPGRDLGGWYSYLPEYNWHTGDAGFAPGHCFGQWTSALARFAATEDDSAARDRVVRLHDLFAAAITPNFFDITRFPAYTWDKLNIGLLDAHALLGSPTAFAIADKVRQCAVPNLPASAMEREAVRTWRKDRDQSYGWDESYTLPENLYLLAESGAGSQFYAAARTYLLDTFFAPLSRNQNVLGGLHGYSHVNALSSAMQAYFVEGDPMHLDAAVNGYRMVEAQSYASGGWAPDELLEKPGAGKLLASLSGTHNSFETPCGTYAMAKLSRYLTQVTRDGHYGDLLERVIYNSMFGALPLQPDGRTFYYADLNKEARRIYSAHGWPCCAGTYTQVAADYGVNSYLLDPEPDAGVWVNLYLPSTIRWETGDARMSLTQSGDYPLGERISFRLEADRPSSFAVHLRIPAWCAAASLTVNGRPVALRSQRGFAGVRRLWRDGDRMELHLPATLRLEPFPAQDAPQSTLAALCWGPLVLLPEQSGPFRREALLGVRRTATTEWQLDDQGHRSTFKPFFAVGDGGYATYLQVV